MIEPQEKLIEQNPLLKFLSLLSKKQIHFESYNKITKRDMNKIGVIGSEAIMAPEVAAGEVEFGKTDLVVFAVLAWIVISEQAI